MRAHQILGVPYSDEEVANGTAAAQEQAAAIADEIVVQGGPEGLADKQIVALIAYLQRLGTDILKPEAGRGRRRDRRRGGRRRSRGDDLRRGGIMSLTRHHVGGRPVIVDRGGADPVLHRLHRDRRLGLYFSQQAVVRSHAKPAA